MSRPGHGPNGWVVYTQGQQPKATLGGRPFGRKPLAAELEASCTEVGSLEPSRVGSTAPYLPCISPISPLYLPCIFPKSPNQVGSIAKVQALLEKQAALLVPIELVAVAGEASQGAAGAEGGGGDGGGGGAEGGGGGGSGSGGDVNEPLSGALLRSCVHAAPRDSIHEAYRRLVTLFQYSNLAPTPTLTLTLALP